MATIEEVKKDIVEKIDLLPLEALEETQEAVKSRMQILVSRPETLECSS